MSLKITIRHLYPDLMNIYGDRGNIIALVQRLKWRNIDVEVVDHTIGARLRPGDTDIYFFGGGQDQAQNSVAQDLARISSVIYEDINNNVVALCVCGGYQLFGRAYYDLAGNEIPGIGVFPVVTRAGSQRMVGNCIVEAQVFGLNKPIIGFENHSGRTRLDDEATPFARVIKGFGNNGEDKTEGCVFNNALGTYLHGSLLPKNPELSDALLAQALHRHDTTFKLDLLDNTLEQQAFNEAQSRFR